MRLRLLEVYGHVTLQDSSGRGLRRYGVPPGGPFDRESAALANVLLDNEVTAAVVELGLGTLVMDAPDGGVLAVVGAECRVDVDGRERAAQGALKLRAGAYVEVGVRAIGARVYLAAAGGFSSSATAPGERLGPGRALVSLEERDVAECRLAHPPTSLDVDLVRVLPGPRHDAVPAVRLESTWRVRAQSDRVGIRLDGEAPPHAVELASEPMCVGAVQATPKGGLLILGPDGPTIGGYPHVATVIEADLDKIAQLRPRDQVRLEKVSPDRAAAAAREAIARWSKTRAQLTARPRS